MRVGPLVLLVQIPYDLPSLYHSVPTEVSLTWCLKSGQITKAQASRYSAVLELGSQGAVYTPCLGI